MTGDTAVTHGVRIGVGSAEHSCRLWANPDPLLHLPTTSGLDVRLVLTGHTYFTVEGAAEKIGGSLSLRFSMAVCGKKWYLCHHHMGLMPS